MWRITQKIKNELKLFNSEKSGQTIVIKIVFAMMAMIVLFVVLQMKSALDNFVNPLLDNEIFGAVMRILWNLLPVFILLFILVMLFTPGSERQGYPPQY